MPTTIPLRALRTTAAFAIGAAAVLAAASPAMAAEPQLTFTVPDNMSVTAGALSESYEVRIAGTGAETVPQLGVTIDLSSFRGTVDAVADGCVETTPDRFGCTFTNVPLSTDGGPLFNVAFRATADAAKPFGSVDFFFEVLPTGTRYSDFKQLEILPADDGTDLASDGDRDLTSRPGGTVDLPLAVHNLGSTDIDGIGLFLSSPYDTPFTTRYSGCEYATTDDHMNVARCLFPGVATAGASYQLSAPIDATLRADTYAPGFTRINYKWSSAEDFGKDQPEVTWRPGTGPALSLVPDASLHSSMEADQDNNYGMAMIKVEGENGVDLVATGSRPTGAAGATVDATVGVTNAGPATLQSSFSHEPFLNVRFTVPQGTTVTSVPDGCRTLEFDEKNDSWTSPGKPRYSCDPGTFLAAGQSYTYTFKLRIDEVIPDSRGAVKLLDPHTSEDVPLKADLNPVNDTSAVVVNATGPDPSPSATAPGGDDTATTAPGNGGGGSSTGDLPVTGTALGAILAAAVALIGGGVAVLIVVRRRREVG